MRYRHKGFQEAWRCIKLFRESKISRDSIARKTQMRIFQIFHHFCHEKMVMDFWSRQVAVLQSRKSLTTVASICATFPALFFDKNGDFSLFRWFVNQSSILNVLHIEPTSNLDTFSTRRNNRRRKDTRGSSSRRSSRKFSKKNCRSAGRFPVERGKPIGKTLSMMFAGDNLIPWTQANCFCISNAVSSDRVWHDAEFKHVRKYTDSITCKIKGRKVSISNPTCIDCWQTKKVFDTRHKTSTKVWDFAFGNSRK